MEALTQRCVGDISVLLVSQEIPEKFNFSHFTISRVWRRAQEYNQNGDLAYDVSSRMSNFWRNNKKRS